MRTDQITMIEAALDKALSFISGDYVVHVDGEGFETGLLTMRWTGDKEGLTIDQAGLGNQEQVTLLFYRSYLNSLGVTITPESFFKIDDERWDLYEGEPINTTQVPLSGIHNIITVQVRRSVAPNQSTPGTDFGFVE